MKSVGVIITPVINFFKKVLEMGKEVNATGLVTYGNSSNREHKHSGDQLELFSKNKLRNIWFKRTDQETNLELTENKHDM
jgi:acyl-homoserine-lactone acylase